MHLFLTTSATATTITKQLLIAPKTQFKNLHHKFCLFGTFISISYLTQPFRHNVHVDRGSPLYYSGEPLYVYKMNKLQLQLLRWLV